MTKQQDIVANISDAELEVLRRLWEASPLSAQDIVERLQDSESVSTHPKTVKTLINRLLKKGALGYHEQHRKYYYYPTLERDVFYAHKSEAFLNKFFDGEVTPLLSSFTRQKKLDSEDLAELKALIKQLEDDYDK